MENRSWNVNQRRVLYEPVDVVHEVCEVLGEGGESLHDLCGVHRGMLTDVVQQRSVLWRCQKVGLWRRQSMGLVDVSNVDLTA